MQATKSNKDKQQTQERMWSDLMVQAQNGSAQSYEQLLSTLIPVLKSFFYKKTQSTAVIDDLTQETILGMHQSRHSYMSEKNFSAWIFSIANYKAIDFFRKSTKNRTTSIEDLTNSPDDIVSTNNSSTEQNLHYKNLLALLDELPPAQRQAIELTKFDGLSTQQAADKIGIKNGVLRVRLHRAYQNLKNKILKSNA